MAVELAAFGITPNALAPGAIETELVARMHSAETHRVYRAGIPLDCYGTPDETAFCAVFLASEQAAISRGIFLGIGLLGHTLYDGYGFLIDILVPDISPVP